MSSLTEILLVLIVAIAFIIVATSVLKFHPVLVLFVASFLVGILGGIELHQIVEKIGSGFGNLLSNIGLMVVFGSILGVLLEKSRALQVIADHIIQLFGSRHSIAAMAFLGLIIGVPVFCDSGFIIMSRLSKMIALNSKVSSASTSIALASGLYATHTLVPPTPGPIAAAGNLGATDQIGIVILIGLIVAIPVIISSLLYAKYMGVNLAVEPVEIELEESNLGKLTLLASIGPILLPILLITISSILKLVQLTGPYWDILIFLGNPNIALLIGIVLALIQLRKRKIAEHSQWIANGIYQAGPILVLTGIGGSFGAILKATPINQIALSIIQDASYSSITLLFVAYGLAALIKTSQGSSTSAIVITSSLLIPFTQSSGFDSPIELALLISAVGAGSMTVSHTNDSYFWVVAQFSGFKINEAYKGFTIATLLQGLVAILTVSILYAILSG